MIYFNEIDAYPAKWLSNLYPDAHVDTRSITTVQPVDLGGYTRCHFFAGIAGWELALSMADCCDDDIGALMEWCQDKRAYSADIRQWFKDKCGVIAKDSEGLPEAVIRTVTTNGQRKRLAKAVEVAALQASNWQTSDDAFFEIVERLTSATGNGSCD